MGSACSNDRTATFDTDKQPMLSNRINSGGPDEAVNPAMLSALQDEVVSVSARNAHLQQQLDELSKKYKKIEKQNIALKNGEAQLNETGNDSNTDNENEIINNLSQHFNFFYLICYASIVLKACDVSNDKLNDNEIKIINKYVKESFSQYIDKHIIPKEEAKNEDKENGKSKSSHDNDYYEIAIISKNKKILHKLILIQSIVQIKKQNPDLQNKSNNNNNNINNNSNDNLLSLSTSASSLSLSYNSSANNGNYDNSEEDYSTTSNIKSLGNFMIDHLNEGAANKVWSRLDQDGSGTVEEEELLDLLAFTCILKNAYDAKKKGIATKKINQNNLKNSLLNLKQWIVINKMGKDGKINKQDYTTKMGKWLVEYGQQTDAPFKDVYTLAKFFGEPEKVVDVILENL